MRHLFFKKSLDRLYIDLYLASFNIFIKGVTKLANHKSALKRARQNEIRRIRNRATKTRVKNAVKEVQAAIETNSDRSAQDLLKQAKSIIDKAAKKGVIHKNTAARKISRLSRMVNSQLS